MLDYTEDDDILIRVSFIENNGIKNPVLYWAIGNGVNENDK